MKQPIARHCRNGALIQAKPESSELRMVLKLSVFMPVLINDVKPCEERMTDNLHEKPQHKDVEEGR